MKNDRETKEKLKESAKAEFLEKGYAKASLRKICSDAGVTTGALYFFFKDKEDLFGSIVSKPFKELTDILRQNFSEDAEMFASGKEYVREDGDHDDLVEKLIHLLYSNREEFLLLLKRSQGTKYENCIDSVADSLEQGYRAMADNYAAQDPGKKVDSYMLHWLAHLHIDSFIHLLTHETDEREALRHMSAIMDHNVSAWMNLILVDE